MPRGRLNEQPESRGGGRPWRNTRGPSLRGWVWGSRGLSPGPPRGEEAGQGDYEVPWLPGTFWFLCHPRSPFSPKPEGPGFSGRPSG